MTNFKLGVGHNLKLIRKAKGITQEDLASIIGIHPRQLSKIETGEHFPSCKTLENACIALDIEPQTLFDFDFLVDSNEGAMTGTDNAAVFQVTKSSKENVYEMFPKSSDTDSKPKTCTDKTMASTAKALNRPVFVEYFEDKKTSKIVVFYPDGKEKVIMNSVDVEAKQNLNYMMKEFKKISKDKAATQFIKLALESLGNDAALKKLDNLVEGMKLARGID